MVTPTATYGWWFKPDEVDLNPRTIALAKQKRDKKLRSTREIYDACVCTFPLQAWRNGHGHAEDCPAVDVMRRHEREDEEAQL